MFKILSFFKDKIKNLGLEHINWKVSSLFFFVISTPLIFSIIRKIMEENQSRYTYVLFSEGFEIVIETLMMLALVFYLWKVVSELHLRNQELFESEARYRQMSITDDLTKIFNVRYFYELLIMETSRANRYGQDLSIILFDIDDFKKYKDTYGHLDGNIVLAKFGQLLKKCSRESDSAYRYGGEEFAVLLPGTSEREGLVVAEKIRQLFSEEELHTSLSSIAYLTVSVGVTEYRHKEDIETFVHRVDQLMYKAKKSGKNRVCCSGEHQVTENEIT